MSEEQTPPAKPIPILAGLAWGAAADIYIFFKYGGSDFAHIMEIVLPLIFLFLISIYNSSIRPGARRPPPRNTKPSA